MIRLAPDVILLDVTAELPKHVHRRYHQVKDRLVERVYSHHSGATGAPGRKGVEASARYVVEDVDHQWPGFAYHLWLAREPERAEDGSLIVYQGNPWDAITNHTGGCNVHGVGLCWQGNLTVTPPTPEQYRMAEVLYPWLSERFKLRTPDGFSMHNEASFYGGRSKKSCPGPHVTKWVKEWRASLAH